MRLARVSHILIGQLFFGLSSPTAVGTGGVAPLVSFALTHGCAAGDRSVAVLAPPRSAAFSPFAVLRSDRLRRASLRAALTSPAAFLVSVLSYASPAPPDGGRYFLFCPLFPEAGEPLAALRLAPPPLCRNPVL